jgi:hypothetical protein
MWKNIVAWFESSGRARAAAELTRRGRPDLAHKIMLGEE